MAKKEHTIIFDEGDLYWVQNLLRKYIVSKDSNFGQKLMALKALHKSLKHGSFDPCIDKGDVRHLKSLVADKPGDNDNFL